MRAKQLLAISLMATLLLSGCQSSTSSDSDTTSNSNVTSAADSGTSSAVSDVSKSNVTLTADSGTSSGISDASEITVEASDSSQESSIPDISIDLTGGALGDFLNTEDIPSDVAPLSVVDATESVDPASLWSVGGSYMGAGAVSTFDAIDAKGETVVFVMHGDSDFMSQVWDVFDDGGTYFIPEYTEMNGSNWLSSLKIYDAAGTPAIGLNSVEGIQAWFDASAAQGESERASAQLLQGDTIKVSELSVDTMYKVEPASMRIINDTGKDCALVLYDGETKNILLTASGFLDGCSYYDKLQYITSDGTETEYQYIKIDTSVDVNALITHAIADDDCVTVSELQAGESSTFKKFVYNDTTSDVTLSYKKSSDTGTVVAKAGELLVFDWMEYSDVTIVG